MPSEQAVIGFMGVGAIGRPMAERLLAQFPVIVCDVSEQARGHFAGRAKTVESARALGQHAEIVFGCLPTLQSYRDAVLSPDALLSGGRVRILVHVGTTGPELAYEINAVCVARGVVMIDAPVTGGPGRARTGQLGVMAAGSRAHFAEVEPLIRTYASAVTYLGSEPGQAQMMKLINNMLSAANLAVASEVLVLGMKAGLEPTQMLEVLNAGTGQNSATLTKIPDHILPRTFNYGGRLEVAHKDLLSLVHQADRLGLSAPLSRLVEATYLKAIAEEGPDADMTRVIRPMERLAQVEVVGKHRQR
jgi:3-hydroxyisobutyrate dehydrogenase-like beta-hydroxyacid dehydrogenase